MKFSLQNGWCKWTKQCCQSFSSGLEIYQKSFFPHPQIYAAFPVPWVFFPCCLSKSWMFSVSWAIANERLPCSHELSDVFLDAHVAQFPIPTCGHGYLLGFSKILQWLAATWLVGSKRPLSLDLRLLRCMQNLHSVFLQMVTDSGGSEARKVHLTWE